MNLIKHIRTHKKKLFLALLLIVSVGYYFCLPKPLFSNPVSTVLLDRNGQLLGAKIASDGQWRFPHNSNVSEKFKVAIIAFEDKRFERHIGVDIWAILRALRLNMQQGRRVSGGSTLTMQTIRMARGNPARNLWEKAKEAVQATRLELGYSKEEILAFYASNAPFGGNVVGLDAAAWKYFQRSAAELSWAEACMLAVLPNSPSLIHLGRNRDRLRSKRDRLLDKLEGQGYLDKTSCRLAKLEVLPKKPKSLPRNSPHLLERVHQELVLTKQSEGLIHSTIDQQKQQQLNGILQRHHQLLQANEIYNAAALIIEVKTGDVVAYAGNVMSAAEQHSPDVDVITAPRSSGSILKPFLYAAMLDNGTSLSRTLFADIPSHFGSYSPKNFDEKFSGVAAANDVITRSLNVPAVHMLQEYGMMRFADKLRQLGMTTLHHSASHYGLTLILGGAETSLWDLGAMYSGLVRNLVNYNTYNGRYDANNFRPLNFIKEKSYQALKSDDSNLKKHSILSASAIWYSFEAMKEVIRPDQEVNWKAFPSAQRVAWKTGTSFGFRDAWAVGCTPDYVVAVWAGNADGEGRPGLVGVRAAAPILFDVFQFLNTGSRWFEEPYDDLELMRVCAQSGHLASPSCLDVVERYEPKIGARSKICPYHQRVHLSKDGQYRVHSDCEAPSEMTTSSYFVLPPTQSWFYRRQQPNYKILPPYRPDCESSLSIKNRELALVYPNSPVKIYVPINLDKTQSRTVFEAKHHQPTTQLFWHLDNSYIGSTQEIHTIELNPSPGPHVITVVDEQGRSVRQSFEVIASEQKKTTK